jgi:hypothetical protein
MFDLGAKPIENPEEFLGGRYPQVEPEGFAGIVTEKFFVIWHDGERI